MFLGSSNFVLDVHLIYKTASDTVLSADIDSVDKAHHVVSKVSHPEGSGDSEMYGEVAVLLCTSRVGYSPTVQRRDLSTLLVSNTPCTCLQQCIVSG